jgi:ribosomal protein L37E
LHGKTWYTVRHYEAYCHACGLVFEKINSSELKEHRLLPYCGVRGELQQFICLRCGRDIFSDYVGLATHQDPCTGERALMVCVECLHIRWC